MGDTISCTLHFAGRSERGTALLEQHDLIFRGPVRLSIPLRDIRSAHAEGGKLTVAFADEASARKGEQLEMPDDVRRSMEQAMQDVRFLDLHHPWFASRG